MKTKQLLLFMAMIVFAIGSVSAQEQSAVKKINEDGTVNEAALTKEELRFAKLNYTPIEELTGRDKFDKLRWVLLDCDTYYIGEDAMYHTSLTREDVVKQGFPNFFYDLLQKNIEEDNIFLRTVVEKYGEKAIPQIIEAYKEADETYLKETRPQLIVDMNAALKQAETEEAAEKAK